MSTRVEPLKTLRHKENAIRSAYAGLRVFWDQGTAIERLSYAAGAAMIASGLFHLIVYAIDGGPWQGPVSWRKPVTFGLSLGLTVISLAWAMALSRFPLRRRTVLLSLFTYTSAIELVLLTMQAWRRVPSHFNQETPFDTVVGLGIGIGGLLTAAGIIYAAVVTLLPGRLNGLAPPLRLALRAGWLALVASIFFGVTMMLTGIGKLALEQQQAAYSAAGWLKPAHAITMHAILVLPALAWLAGHLPWTPTRRYRVTVLAVAGYAMLAIAVVGETIARQNPFTAPMWTNVVAVTGCAGLIVAVAQVLVPLASQQKS